MVYFLQDSTTHAIKIGYAISPSDRATTLQTGNPSELILLYERDGDRQDEADLHKRFAAHRLAGEWFNPAPDLLKFILNEAFREASLEGRLAGIHAMSKHGPHASGIDVPAEMTLWWVEATQCNKNGASHVRFAVLTNGQDFLPDVKAAIRDLFPEDADELTLIDSVRCLDRVDPSESTSNLIHDQRPKNKYGCVQWGEGYEALLAILPTVPDYD